MRRKTERVKATFSIPVEILTALRQYTIETHTYISSIVEEAIKEKMELLGADVVELNNRANNNNGNGDD